MPALFLTPLLVRALYDDALALACAARQQLALVPDAGQGAGQWLGPNVLAMPAIAELVRLIANLADLMAKVAPSLSHVALPPRDTGAQHERRSMRTAASPLALSELNQRVARIGRRYERLHQPADQAINPMAGGGVRWQAASPAGTRR